MRFLRLSAGPLGGEIMESDSLEQRVRRNTPRLALVLLGVAATSELVRRVLRLAPDHVFARLAVALLVGVRSWCVIMALFVLTLWGTVVLTTALNRRFPSQTSRTSSLVLGAVLLIVVVACFFFVPFCLGSLSEGTYDCITLAERTKRSMAGG